MLKFLLVNQVSTPFYQDWTFWAFFVSGIAVILSQLSPVYLWFKSAKIELDILPRIQITHKVGNPNFQTHINITNIGGRVIKIQKLVAEIYRENQKVTEIECRTFQNIQSNNNKAILFTPFRLKVKEEWSEIVHFYNLFSREDDKEYRKLESNLKYDIFQKREKLEDKSGIVTADEINIEPLKQFMTKKFIWYHGDYQIIFNIKTAPKKASFSKSFRFIIFESDEELLKNYQDDFKFGAGIYYDSPNQTGINLEITEAIEINP